MSVRVGGEKLMRHGSGVVWCGVNWCGVVWCEVGECVHVCGGGKVCGVGVLPMSDRCAPSEAEEPLLLLLLLFSLIMCASGKYGCVRQY